MARSTLPLLLQVVLIFASANAEHESVMACHVGWDKTGVPREHVDEGECVCVSSIVGIVCRLLLLCDFLRSCHML